MKSSKHKGFIKQLSQILVATDEFKQKQNLSLV